MAALRVSASSSRRPAAHKVLVGPIASDDFAMLRDCLGENVLASRIDGDVGVLIVTAQTDAYVGGLGASKFVAQWLDILGINAQNMVAANAHREPLEAHVYHSEESDGDYLEALSIHRGSALDWMAMPPGRWLPWGSLEPTVVYAWLWGIVTIILTFVVFQQVSGHHMSILVKVLGLALIQSTLILLLFMGLSVIKSRRHILACLLGDYIIACVGFFAYGQADHISPLGLLGVLSGIAAYLIVWALAGCYLLRRSGSVVKTIVAAGLTVIPAVGVLKLVDNSVLGSVNAQQFDVPLNEFSIAAYLHKSLLVSGLLVIAALGLGVWALTHARQSVFASGMSAIMSTLLGSLGLLFPAVGVVNLGNQISIGSVDDIPGVVQSVCYRDKISSEWSGPVVVLGKIEGNSLYVVGESTIDRSARVTVVPMPNYVQAAQAGVC